MPPKITLYHLVNSKSTRILVLLEELGLEYDLKKFERMDNNLAPSEFEKVHPIGQAPIVVIEEEGETITLAESGAIVQYLVERHGRQLMPEPADLKATAAYMYWMHFAEGTFMPLVLASILAAQIPALSGLDAKTAKQATVGIMNSFVSVRMKRNWDLMDRELKKAGGQYWCANKFTGADIMMFYALDSSKGLMQDYPALLACHKGFTERPSYKRAIEIGGPLDFDRFTNNPMK